MEKDWSKLAEKFDELQKLVTGEFADREIKTALSQIENLGNVLELGCGSGNYTKSLIPHSDSILCTDISEDMVSVAKERLKEFSNVKVEEANSYETGLQSSLYDSIFMANLIHVVHKPEAVLQEAHRLLKENGRLIIVSFTMDGLSFLEKIKLMYRFLKYFGTPPKGGRKFSLRTLQDFVTKYHFEVEEAKMLGEKMSRAMFLIARKQ